MHIISKGRSMWFSLFSNVFVSKNDSYHGDFKMLTADEILKKIKENKEKIKKFGVKRIGLFGSYLRNEQKTESDIDILVEFERGKKTFDNYMDLKFFLEDLFKCKVDLVIVDALKPDLKPIILRSVKYATGV